MCENAVSTLIYILHFSYCLPSAPIPPQLIEIVHYVLHMLKDLGKRMPNFLVLDKRRKVTQRQRLAQKKQARALKKQAAKEAKKAAKEAAKAAKKAQEEADKAKAAAAADAAAAGEGSNGDGTQGPAESQVRRQSQSILAPKHTNSNHCKLSSFS
jgi:hypothetical protein